MIRWVTLVTSLLISQVAHGQWDTPETPRIPEGEDIIEPVGEGDLVPFDGLLLDTSTATRWLNGLRFWKETFRLRLSNLRERERLIVRSYEDRLRSIEDIYLNDLGNSREEVHRQEKRALRLVVALIVSLGVGAILGVSLFLTI